MAVDCLKRNDLGSDFIKVKSRYPLVPNHISQHMNQSKEYIIVDNKNRIDILNKESLMLVFFFKI